ncbi:hypothetical protein GCM10027062_07290 [Nocardioides hungaricus]
MPAPQADLLVSIARASRLVPAAVSAMLGLAVIVVPLAVGVRFDFIDVTLLLHLSMAVTLGGTALVLEDRAIASTRVLPISAARVALVRMAMSTVVLTPAWVVQLVAAPHLVLAAGGYAATGLFIEPYAVLAWTWTAAWWRVNHSPDGSGASIAAPAMLIGLIAIGFLPDPIALYVNPADPGFAGSRVRWLLLLLTGIVALLCCLRATTPRGSRPSRS